MKKIITSICIISMLTLSACGGRQANLTSSRHLGDKKLSCKTIKLELIQVESNIKRLIPKTDKTGKNVALGVAGWFLIIPWFFMDLSNAEQQEVTAYQERYDALIRLSSQKNCDLIM